MAICMKCGAILNDEDMEKNVEHICDDKDVPKKGEEIKFNGVKVAK